MPESLKLYLQQLSNEDADELWEWLDGNRGAVDEMIEEISISHTLLSDWWQGFSPRWE